MHPDQRTTSNARTDDRHYYECRDCLTRTVRSGSLEACPSCGGGLRNIAVGRE